MDKSNGRQILINPVTRIEGHARITINLDEQGKADRAVFHVNEFRGFEKFCEGRMYTEMPTITPRICGICPISHTLASVKACEMIQGIRPARTGDLLRRLLQLGQHVSSHSLSFFYLSAPDLLLGYDVDPGSRNIIGVAQRFPEIARRGIRLRQFGQEISERITGKKIHSMGIAPGGTTFPLTEGNRADLQKWIPEVKGTAKLGLDIIRRFMDENPGMVRSFATAPTAYLGTVGPEGQHELYDGRLRFVDQDGGLLQDQVDPARYLEFIAERSVDWSCLTSSSSVPGPRPWPLPTMPSHVVFACISIPR
jgi:NAD-reducing hydrogenase large subunit